MIASISPSAISGHLWVPASKSVSQRALILACMRKGITRISGIGKSRDEQAALQCLPALGASVEQEGAVYSISSDGIRLQQQSLHVMESGLLARLLVPIVSLHREEVTVTGEGSLLNRPMHFFDRFLPVWGVNVISRQGLLPIRVKGPLHMISGQADAMGSSQYISGLLMALAAETREHVHLTVSNMVSYPYLALTVQMLGAFGFRVEESSPGTFSILPARHPEGPLAYRVEGDWSQAAALLCAAISSGSSIQLSGLNEHSLQSDRYILNILTQCGVSCRWEGGSLYANPGPILKPFTADATHAPDLFPVLTALAAACKGSSSIRGVHRLLHKESNRAQALQETFHALGVHIYVDNDTFKITGVENLQTGNFEGYGDHRMVMALTIAGLRTRGGLSIRGAEAIEKSYPDFFRDLQSMGADIKIEQ